MKIKSWMSKFGKFLDATGLFAKRLVVFIILLIFIGALFSSGSGDKQTEILEGSILSLDLRGYLVEEKTQSEFEAAIAEFSGESTNETLVSDVVNAIEMAKNDESISFLLVEMDDFLGGSPTKLQNIADAIRDFKESEKKVIAYSGYGYNTPQYYLASLADEVHMHDYAAIYISGYRSYRTYYKSFFDKFYIDSNVFKVGEFKAFVEPYFRDSMSEESKNNIIEWISVLWSSYLEEVAFARGIEIETLEKYIQSLDEVADESNDDLAVASLDMGLIDKLSNKREFRDYLYSLAPGEEDNEINIVGRNDYLNISQIESNFQTEEDNVGLIIATGGIVDGSAGPGSIAGDDFIKLIRDAYEDESIKALVLRVDSGGGSAYASEVIADELEKFKSSGRPIVASMGGVAASGGYYISAPANQIFAEPHTITGSIGVGGFIPTFERALDYIGIHEDGYSTVDLTMSVAKTLTEKDKKIMQSGTDLVYKKFITKVGENRNMTIDEVDKIARGKVWIGQKALEIGLVDQLGTLAEAIDKAAELAELEKDTFGVKTIDRESQFEKIFGIPIAKTVIGIMKIMGINLNNSNLKVLNNLSNRMDELNSYNDPRGIYMNCFCELK